MPVVDRESSQGVGIWANYSLVTILLAQAMVPPPPKKPNSTYIKLWHINQLCKLEKNLYKTRGQLIHLLQSGQLENQYSNNR